MDRENSPINCLLEQAASIARRSKITAGTLEPTESYKRGQIEDLKSFANSFDLWIDLSNLEITYMDKGQALKSVDGKGNLHWQMQCLFPGR